MVGPAMNELRVVLTCLLVAAVPGSATSTFDLGAELDDGLLLTRLPKGALGEDSCCRLGSFVVPNVWQTRHRPRPRQLIRRRPPAAASRYVKLSFGDIAFGVPCPGIGHRVGPAPLAPLRR